MRPGVEQSAWADRTLRALGFHYFVRTVVVAFDMGGHCYLYAGPGGNCIGYGATLGRALEFALARLSDEEVLKAADAVEAEADRQAKCDGGA